MSSNNLDEKILFQYITKCFQNWGITYLTQQVMKKCKKNEDQAIQPMIRLLFDLCLLHIFNYQYFPNELNISFEQKQSEMLEIIVAHLYQVDCPFILVRQQKDKTQISFDFTSSLYLLISCGWIMGVSNFFGQTVQKLFKKKANNIYKPKPLNFANLSKKYLNIIKTPNYHQQTDKLTRISYLAKILKSRKYTVECLMDKKAKILKKLKKQLKNIDVNLNLEDILSTVDAGQIQVLEAELRDDITYQKQNMGYRKYWWIWLDQKIITSQYRQLAQKFQGFQKLQANPQDIKYSINIDLQFVSKYFDSLQNVQSKIDTISHQIQSLNIKSQNNFKQIQRQIYQELKLAKQQKNQTNNIPSFIGMQLKNYMNLTSKNPQVAKSSKKGISKSSQKSYKKLSQSIRNFISQIDAIVVI